MNIPAEIKALSENAIEVLGQLFVNGPTWDGNIISKPGRGELFHAGLVLRVNGFAFLTEEGVRIASEWNVRRDRDGERWYKKRHCCD